MNGQDLADQKDEASSSQPKLLGIPRPWAGAFIGILVFLLLFSIAWFAESKYLIFGLLFPYFVILFLFGKFVFGLSTFGTIVLIVLTSSLAPAIIGSMVASKEQKRRSDGITFLGIYLFTSLVAGFLISVVASISN